MILEAAIFDMDGVIFDTERLGLTMYKKAVKTFGYNFNNQDYFRIIGHTVEESKKIIINKFGADFPFDNIRKMRYKLTDEYIKLNGIPMKKNVFDIFNFLKGNNIKIAIATSTNKQRATTLLSKSGLLDFINVLVCGDEIKKSKPDPEIFIRAVNKLKIKKENCIIIEDSIVGIKAAINADIKSIMIPDLIKPTKYIKENNIVICKSLKNAIWFIKSNCNIY